MSSLMAYYLLFKTLHILAIIGWMFSLLYIPRLFVRHADAAPGSETDTLLQELEQNLLRRLSTPCMIIVFITGILLLMAIAGKVGGWFLAKFLLVIMLAGLHGMMSGQRKRFERGENTKSAGYFHTVSQVTTVVMIIVVSLAVLKPF